MAFRFAGSARQDTLDSKPPKRLFKQTHLFDHSYHSGHEHDAGGLWGIMHTPEEERSDYKNNHITPRSIDT